MKGDAHPDRRLASPPAARSRFVRQTSPRARLVATDPSGPYLDVARERLADLPDIAFLRADGTVKRSQKIASATGGFTGRLKSLDWFGFSLASAGDLDGDGVTDLAVGTALDDDGGVNAGAVWLLYLRPDGTVNDQRKISMLVGGFTGAIDSPDQFGTSVARVGDLNGDGITELAVGAVKDGDGGKERGAASSVTTGCGPVS